MGLLTVAGLVKRYGDKTVLDHLDLDIDAGEVVALLGPNGAGKTTLVSIVAGLRPFEAGSVTVAGIDVGRSPRAARERMGLAPQELGVYPPLTVRENLAFFGRLAGLESRAVNARIDELVPTLDLDDLADKRAALLSGGQKRRLHTAMALMSRAPLLLLDEPTVGADVDSRRRLLDVVRHLALEGAAICYTTHYLGEVEELDARVAILHEGRIATDSRVSELITRHGHGHVELRFDGAAPSLPGAVRDATDVSVLRFSSSEPASAAGVAISHLGEDARRVRSVEIVRDGLEAAYRNVTGTALDDDDEIEKELQDVAAS
ncbi:MAG: ABC transporter ATP-binding protein [Actinomycetota bacterium]